MPKLVISSLLTIRGLKKFVKRLQKTVNHRPAFTMIELLVVVSIIGILTGVGTYSFNNAQVKARDTRRKQDAAQIKAALALYYEDNKTYPPTSSSPGSCTPTTSGSTTYTICPSNLGGDNWIPGLSNYLQKIPKDPKQSGIIQKATNLAQNLKQQIGGAANKLASAVLPQKPASNQTAQEKPKGQVAGIGTATCTLNNVNDSAQIIASGPSYPPAALTVFGASRSSAGRWLAGGTYNIVNGFLRWDVSTCGIPAGATVSSASLNIYTQDWNNVDARFLTADWLNNWYPITTASYSQNALTNAIPGTSINNIGSVGYHSIGLSNAAANINLTGYTGLRFHVSGVNPTGLNTYGPSQNYTTAGQQPQLVITYTTVSIPTLTTPTVASSPAVTESSATIGATVTDNGGAAITSRGTCWGTSPAPTTNCLVEGGTAISAFTQARTGLPSNTTIYYRGYASNSAGPGYSPDGNFKTAPPPPAPLSPANGATVNPGLQNITWGNMSAQGATQYWLRVWDTTLNPNNLPDGSVAGYGYSDGGSTALCTANSPKTTGDVCYTVPSGSTTAYSYQFITGHVYGIWVHSVNAANTNSNAVGSTVYVTGTYYATYGADAVPTTVAGNTYLVPLVHVTNSGTATWANSGANPVLFSAHWYQGACTRSNILPPGLTNITWDLPRTAYSNATLAPSQTSADMYPRIQAIKPDGTALAVGTYCLVYDMVREGDCWLDGIGGSCTGGITKNTTVTVTAALTPPTNLTPGGTDPNSLPYVAPGATTFSWTPVAGAGFYDLGINEDCTTPTTHTNGWGPTYGVNTGDISTRLTAATFSYTTQANKQYCWWVHTVNPAATSYSADAMRYFTTTPPNPTVTLTADYTPNPLILSGKADLSWITTNSPTSCDRTTTTSPPNAQWNATGIPGTNSVLTVTGITATTTFRITCHKAGYPDVFSEATVNVDTTAPSIVSFTASPPTIIVGGSSTLQWTSANATNCSTNAGGSGPSGSISVSPIANTTYTLTCTKAGFPNAVGTVEVRVNQPSLPTNSCTGTVGIYCFVATQGAGGAITTYTIWLQLENKNDPEIYTNPGAKCNETSPDPTLYNYCIKPD